MSDPHPAHQDEAFMAATLALGRRYLGLTAPNPAVGALVVKDGVVVGRGMTKPGGRPHAETEAITQAGAQAKGATLYVTLEPCSHHGVTPPCADAILAAGIARVVSAMDDPDPRVAGQGHARLRGAGVEVIVGVLQAEAQRAHLGHILRVTQGRPMVTLKLAETADGYAAGGEHDPRLMITGLAANNVVQMMRAQHDAIMIGSGTAMADDPLLTVRLPGVTAKPWRVVLDSHLKLSLRSRLVQTAHDWPTLVVCGDAAPTAQVALLIQHHVEVVRVSSNTNGHVELAAALQVLGTRGLTRVFSEGGPLVGSALIQQGLADQVILVRAPRPLLRPGVPALTPDARATLARTDLWRLAAPTQAGVDRLFHHERIAACSPGL